MPRLPDMNVSVLLRLVPGALTEGRVAGHAEVVDTGETAVFKDLEEMVAFLRSAGSRDLMDGPPPEAVDRLPLPTSGRGRHPPFVRTR